MAALRQREDRNEQSIWDDLDMRSKALKHRMVQVGVTRPFGSHEGMLRLTVGGFPVNIRRYKLEERGYLGDMF